jgi:hypothetical protein
VGGGGIKLWLGGYCFQAKIKNPVLLAYNQVQEYNGIDRLGVQINQNEPEEQLYDAQTPVAEGRADFGGVHGILAASGNMEPFMAGGNPVAAIGGLSAQDALLSQLFNMDSSNCFQKFVQSFIFLCGEGCTLMRRRKGKK